MKRVNEDAPRPIVEIVPTAPQWLCDLIARLHAKNPQDRLASAQEVIDSLAPGSPAVSFFTPVADTSGVRRAKVL